MVKPKEKKKSVRRKKRAKRETNILMPKSEKSKKTGRVEAYTFGEATRSKDWPHK